MLQKKIKYILIFLGLSFTSYAQDSFIHNFLSKETYKEALIHWKQLPATKQQELALKLIQILKEEKGKKQKYAAKALGDIAEVRAIPFLIETLHSPENKVRYSAIHSLSQFGSKAKTAIPLLCKMLQEKNCRLRQKAIRALSQIGKEIPSTDFYKVILAALHDEYIRNEAISMLKEWNATTKDFLPLLFPKIQSQDRIVFYAVLEIIGEMGTNGIAAAPILIEFLQNPKVRRSPEVQNFDIQPKVIQTLEQLGEGVVPYLIQTIKTTEDPLFRHYWISTLGRFKETPKQSISFLIELLRNNTSFVIALKTLAQFEQQDIPDIPELLVWLHDEDWKISITSAKILVKSHKAYDEIFEILLERLKIDFSETSNNWHENFEYYSSICDLLEKLAKEEPKFIPKLIELLQDQRDWVRKDTIKILASLKELAQEAIPMLIKLSNESNKRIQNEAIQALCEIAQKPELTIPILLREVEKSKISFDSNFFTPITGFTNFGKNQNFRPKVVSVLTAALKKEKAKLRSFALSVFVYFPEEAKNLFPFFKELALHDKNIEVRKNAIRTLGLLQPDSLDFFLSLLKETEEVICYESAQVLIKRGKEEPKVITALIKCLQDSNELIRKNATIILGKLGPNAAQAIPELRIKIKDHNKKVQLYAIWALGKMGSLAKEALPDLTNILESNLPSSESDESVKLLQAARWATFKINKQLTQKTSSIEEHLSYVLGQTKALYFDPFPTKSLFSSERNYISQGIGCPTEDSIDRSALFLIDRTRKSTGEQRVSLFKKLNSALWAGYSTREAIPLLLEGLEDKNKLVRFYAAKAFGRFYCNKSMIEVVQVLIEDLQDSEKENRYLIALALGECRKCAIEAIPFLLKTLEEKDSLLRQEAIWALGNIVNYGTIFDLIQEQQRQQILNKMKLALKDKDWKIRLSAIINIPEIYQSQNSEILKAVVATLKDKNENIRFEAAFSLSLIDAKNKVALPLLKQALHHKLVYFRGKAVDVLSKTKSKDKEIVFLLRLALQDKDEIVRENAILTLERLGIKEKPEISHLIKTLQNEKGWARTKALKTLSTIKTPCTEVVPLLISFLKEENSFRNEELRKALKNLIQKDEDSLSLLIEACQDSNKNVRAQAILVLGSLRKKTRQISSVLDVALVDPNKNVRLAAALTLHKMDGAPSKYISILIESLKEENFLGKENTKKIILQIDRKILVPELFKALKSENARLRSSIILLLGECELSKNILLPILFKNLQHSNYNVRNNAISVIGKMKVNSPQFVAKLVEILAKDPNTSVCSTAVEVLGQIGKPHASKLVIPLLKRFQKNPQDKGFSERLVRNEIITVLGNWGPVHPDIIPALRTILKNEDKFIQELTIQALGKMRQEGLVVVPKLIKMFKIKMHPLVETMPIEDSVLINALVRIGRHTEAIYPILIEALESPENEIKKGVLSVLQGLREEASDAVPAVIKRLQDQDVGVKISAVWTLGIIGKEHLKTIPALIVALQDQEIDIQVIRELGKFGTIAVPSIPSLIALYKKTSAPSMQLEIIETLGNIGELTDTKFLVKNLAHSKDSFRLKSAVALIQMHSNHKAGIEVLTQFLQSKNVNIYRKTLWALARLGPAASTTLDVLLQNFTQEHISCNRHDSCLENIINIFGSFGPMGLPAMPTLINALEHPNSDIQRSALQAIGAIDSSHKEIIPRVKKLLKAERFHTRLEAAILLSKMHSFDPTVLPILTKEIKQDKRHINLPVEALGRFGILAAQKVPLLINILQNEDMQEGFCPCSVIKNFKSLIWALGEMGPAAKKAIPVLEKYLSHKNLEIKESAKKAITKLKTQ